MTIPSSSSRRRVGTRKIPFFFSHTESESLFLWIKSAKQFRYVLLLASKNKTTLSSFCALSYYYHNYEQDYCSTIYEVALAGRIRLIEAVYNSEFAQYCLRRPHKNYQKRTNDRVFTSRAFIQTSVQLIEVRFRDLELELESSTKSVS